MTPSIEEGNLAVPSDTITDVPIIIDEVYHREVYTKGLDLSPDKAVIDIGANIGIFSLYMAGLGVAEVHAYEPNAENFRCLEMNAETGCGRIKVYNEAVADCVGSRLLYQSAYSGGHLLFPRSGEGELSQWESVNTVDLAAVLDRARRPVQLVKMDCEGAEGLILGAADLSKLEVEAYAIEYHDNVSPCCRTTLAERLQKAGYKVRVEHREGPFGYIHAIR